MTRVYRVLCDQCGETVPEAYGPEFIHLSVARHRVEGEQIATFLEIGFGTAGELDLCVTCFGALCRHLKAERKAP